MRARLRYTFAEERAGKWPLKALCCALGVSESGYYRYRKNKDKPNRDEFLSGEIQKILDESPYNSNYGVRWVQVALVQRGVLCGLRRLTRLMRERGWLHERKRRPKGLTKADELTMAAENLLHQDFYADIIVRYCLKGDIDVHTVRERVQNDDGSFDPMGPLTERQSQAVTVISIAAEGDAAAEPGTSFAERFEKYAPFGITYEEAEGASGAGNVYYKGQLVSQFADLTPDGGAFTFSSAKQGGITVKTVYDNSGKLIGVEAV